MTLSRLVLESYAAAVAHWQLVCCLALGSIAILLHWGLERATWPKDQYVKPERFADPVPHHPNAIDPNVYVRKYDKAREDRLRPSQRKAIGKR